MRQGRWTDAPGHRGGMLALAAGFALTVGAATEPRWISAADPAPAYEPSRFTRAFHLAHAPSKAWVRVHARDRYRLTVNGRPVSVGDTPWDAETVDITPLVRAGDNMIGVDADADVQSPDNCFIWLRRRLAAPAAFERLSFRTRDARQDEWLYVEVVDDKGRTSGFYCVERRRPDLLLGRHGNEREHVIALRQEPTLAYRTQSGACDFSRLVEVGIRLDRKQAHPSPAGQVALGAVRLHGAADADLGGAAGWRLEPGAGEHRRSRLEPGSNGFFVVRYDFTPAPDPCVSVDVQAWGPTGAITRVVSDRAWQANGRPALLPEVKRDSFAWSPLAIEGPGARISPPLAAAVRVAFDSVRGVEGVTNAVSLQVWAADALPDARVRLRLENWQGDEVFSQNAALAWRGAEGRARVALPGLPCGLYRVDASLAGMEDGQRRHAAYAVLAAGETNVASVIRTLTPIARRGMPLQGVDTSWRVDPALMLGFRDQGINFLQVHMSPRQLDNGEFNDLLAFCRATGLRFAINNESANWSTNAPGPDGRCRFAASDGCHRWDLAPEALDAAAATGLFEGVVYDEGEHMQLCRNRIAFPRASDGRPYLVETTGMTLEESHAAFTGAARQVNRFHRRHGARMIVESVFPSLWHPLAQAGVTLCPKLLKEDVYPVVLALALGAAKQYGAELWFTPDFWSMGHFPGHSVEKYTTALRLAHAAGVDNVYTEHFIGLCRIRGATYEFSEYGAALQAFLRDAPSRAKRGYGYLDYEPEVAIIRFPDSDWGQASCYYWDTLYGALDRPPTPETGEWMQVFSLLTGGRSDPRAVNANSAVYPRYEQPVMMPCPPTAVYDHNAGPELLRGVRTLFLCGVTVSPETLAAVEACVRRGATCFAAARLCPERVRRQAAERPARVDDKRGAWIVLDGFRPEDLGPYEPLLPPVGHALRLKFKGRDVAFAADATEPGAP